MSDSRTNIKLTINLNSAFLLTYLFIILWLIIGFIAFITSIVCFIRSGTIGEKIVGLILAILLGPFYFLFFIFRDGYCE
jgi:hypothetical protein